MNDQIIKGGYQHVDPQLGNFIHGDGLLGDAPINPSGDWSAYLPPDNIQNRNGFEPYDCVTQAILGCVEILARFEYIDTDNWSRRYLATVSGTGDKQGNDPQTVAENLRHGGCVLETDYLFTAPDLATFYQKLTIALQQLAAYTFRKYQYGHSWVNANPTDMMNALTYSPLSVGGWAWTFDPQTGYAISPQGAVPEHSWVIYGYVKDSHWLAWDSYNMVKKNVAWNFPFVGLKRHTLHRVINTDFNPQAVGTVNWKTWINVIRRWLRLPQI